MLWGANSFPDDSVGKASASGHLPQFHPMSWGTQLGPFSIGRIPSYYKYQDVPMAEDPELWIKMASDNSGGHILVFSPMLAEAVVKGTASLKESAAYAKPALSGSGTLAPLVYDTQSQEGITVNSLYGATEI